MQKIAISGINLFEGGTLSILRDCISVIEESDKFKDLNFIILVHQKKMFQNIFSDKIKFIEFPKSRNSYLYRIYYEYFFFKKFAIKEKIDFWISIHDMTPTLKDIPQVVYCHNSTPFKKINFKDLIVQPKIFLFSFLYSLVYKINIKKNKFVIVQQLWLKNEFSRRYNLQPNKIIVALPKVPEIEKFSSNQSIEKKIKTFFYPTFSRSFKNIEIICEAANLLENDGVKDFVVNITIDGTENRYSKTIFEKYKRLKRINFIGLVERKDVYELYHNTDCLIFPSKLETWGLPISEFKQFDKPILVANLPYAHETIGIYSKAKFFDSSDPIDLARHMKKIILNEKIEFDMTSEITYPEPFANNWEELLLMLLR